MRSRQINELWKSAKGLLIERYGVGSSLAKMNLSYLTLLGIDRNYLVFSVGFGKIKVWFEEYCIVFLQDAFRELLGAEYEIILIELSVSDLVRKLQNGEDSSVSIEEIQRAVEKAFNISHKDLVGAKRSSGISYPRQLAMYLTRNLTTLSLPEIGRAFGKDHSSVMYAVNRISKELVSNENVKADIKMLEDML